jgi:hypothetical protein
VPEGRRDRVGTLGPVDAQARQKPPGVPPSRCAGRPAGRATNFAPGRNRVGDVE